jgi:hypothetical protein
MPADSGRGLFVRAGVVTLVALIVWRLTTIATGIPALSPLGPQPVYASVDPPELVTIEPVLHAAWLSDAGGPLAWAAAFFALLGAAGVAIFAGATTAAALCVLASLVLDASFSAALEHSAGLAVSVGLVWLGAGAAFDDRPRLFTRPVTLNATAAIALWALAVWWDWIAVVGWPVVWAALRRAPDRRDRGLLTAASLVLGIGAFVAHFAWMASVANAVTTNLSAPVTWRDALWVAFDARRGMPPGSFAAPELTTRLGYFLMLLSAAGLVFGELARWWRRTVLFSAALAVAVALVWSEWQAEVLRFSAWVLAPLSAVGLTWVAAQGRRPLVITCALGAVALMETLVSGSRSADGLDTRGFRDALAEDLMRRLTVAPLVVVAEDTLVDSALVSWMATRTPQVLRAAQDGAAVARARVDGRTVIAGPVGRRHLELAGVSFAESYAVHPQTSFQLSEADGTFRCATVRTDRWSQLPGLEYTGRLGIELPGRLGGELQLVVGDALPLPLRASLSEGRAVPLPMDPLMSGPGAAAPPADYWIDGSVPEDAPAWMRRVHLAADPLRPSMLSLELGRRAPRVLARLAGYEDEARGRICAAPLGVMRLQQPGATSLPLDDEGLFGAGWYGREGTGSAAFRWAAADAVVLVRSAMRADVEVRLQAAPAAVATAGDVTVGLRVNDVDVGTRVMKGERADHTWHVPAGVWLAGTNELWWHASGAVRPADAGGSDTRLLALRVTAITLERH